MWLRCLDGSPGIQGSTDRTGYKEKSMNIFPDITSQSFTFQRWDDSLECFTQSEHLEQKTCSPPRVGALHLKSGQSKENLELHRIIVKCASGPWSWTSPWSSTSWWQRRGSSGCCEGWRPGRSHLLIPAPLRCRSGRDSRGNSKLKWENILEIFSTMADIWIRLI